VTLGGPGGEKRCQNLETSYWLKGRGSQGRGRGKEDVPGCGMHFEGPQLAQTLLDVSQSPNKGEKRGVTGEIRVSQFGAAT